jgi:hypothetical protein
VQPGTPENHADIYPPFLFRHNLRFTREGGIDRGAPDYALTCGNRKVTDYATGASWVPSKPDSGPWVANHASVKEALILA